MSVPWVTVTVQVAVVPLPSAAVAVMEAVPGRSAVIVPCESTLAMVGSELSQ